MSVELPPSMGRTLEDLERRVAALERTRQLESASYQSPGRITYNDRDGNRIIYIGRVIAGGHSSDGMLVYRPDGTLAFAVYEPGPGLSTLVAMYDAQGNGIVGEDVVSGGGLARPYIPLPFTRDLLNNEAQTSSSTFVNLWRLDANLQHSNLRVRCYLRGIGGAAGEAIIYDETDGVQVGSPVTITAGQYAERTLDVTHPSPADGAYHDLRVRGRVTNGTGTLGVEVVSAYGVQS